MRYLTALVQPTTGGVFHPLADRLRAESRIRREAIHHVELLEDGTVLLLGEGSGDRDRYERIMADSPSVDDFLVTGDDRWMAVSRFEPTPALRRALDRQRAADVVLEMPILVREDGSMRVTYLGGDEALRRLFRDASEVDASLRFEVLETGDYQPGRMSLVSALTTRQQEVLEAAVEIGYYGAPREATLDDVAEAVGVAPTTVGEHLRKIEHRVFSSLVG